MSFMFTLLDPRRESDAFDFLTTTPSVLGIEVTVDELAWTCSLGNLDPQHTGGDATTAAIEAALTWPVPPAGTTLATMRPDPDALGAMAVLTLRADGQEIAGDVLTRVNMIATVDKERAGPWPGPRHPIRAEDMVTPVSVVGAVCMDHRIPLAQRVAAVREWLLNGSVPEEESIRARLVEDVEKALAGLDVQVVSGVAVVTGVHRLAMDIGYRHAPIVVATMGGETHVKHTIGRWNSAVPMDWDNMLAYLGGYELGWDGSSSICGSPQGTGSELTTDKVVEIVTRHIKSMSQLACG
jgi:hypothetical protein